MVMVEHYNENPPYLGDDTEEVFADFEAFRIEAEAGLGIFPAFDICYHRPKELKFLYDAVDPRNFLKYCLQREILDGVTGDYGFDCEKLCENATAYILLQLKRKNMLEKIDYEICSGTFCHRDHTWLRIGDYYVDLTLKQFVKNAFELSIIPADKYEKKHYYQTQHRYPSLDKWLY